MWASDLELPEMTSADKLYELAMDAGHPYHRDKTNALSLVSRAGGELSQPIGIPNMEALKIAISYIHFAESHSIFEKRQAIVITDLLRRVIDSFSTNRSEQHFSFVLKHVKVVLPWLWKGSERGIQSHFADFALKLVKPFRGS